MNRGYMLFNDFLRQIEAIIFSGGEKITVAHYQKYLNFKTIKKIVAADKGLLYATKDGYKVDFALGDFDSLPAENYGLLANIEHKKYCAAKDFSDTELAVQYLEAQGYQNIAIIGGAGARVDHYLANLQLFHKYQSCKCWITNYELILANFATLTFVDQQEATISFFSLKPTEIVGQEGFAWRINFPINALNMSLSNKIINSKAMIKINRGCLLAILPFMCKM